MHRLLFSSVALTLLLSSRPCRAVELREDLGFLSSSIAQYLKKQGEQTVSIGQFSAPPQAATSGGNGISQFLMDDLPKQGLQVQRRSRYGLKGDFHTEKNQFGRLFAKIDVQVVDTNGEVAIVLNHEVSDDQAIAELMGVSVDLGRDAELDTIEKAIKNPTFALTGYTVRTKGDSPYGIEITKLVNGQYVGLTPVDDEGLATVQLARDDVYAVRLVNNSGIDAAVSLSIDGISMFTFSESPQFHHVIITKERQSGLVKGWHRNNQISDAFQVMEYSKSAVAKVMPDSVSVGTITATFKAAWPEGTDPPPGEPQRFMTINGAQPGAGAPDATGRGRQVEQRYTTGTKRETGIVRSIVTVRYSK